MCSIDVYEFLLDHLHLREAPGAEFAAHGKIRIFAQHGLPQQLIQQRGRRRSAGVSLALQIVD
jgi:hypothetical protein